MKLLCQIKNREKNRDRRNLIDLGDRRETDRMSQ